LASRSTTPSAAFVEAELIRLFYRHTWLMSAVVGLSGSVFTAYMFADAVPKSWAVGWLIAINAVIATRMGLILRFSRRQPPLPDFRRWGRYHVATVWLNGLAWGLPALALASGDLTLTFFYATVICGFVAGAIPGLSYSLSAYQGFAIFSAAPLTMQMFAFDETFFHVIGVLAVLFVAINIASVRISHQRIREQIRLEFANRQLVENLTAEKERAERADAVKSRFLAAASHDLRQPLHALGLFVEALDTQTRAPHLRQLIDNIKLSTTSLRDLLNALLDISRLDAGALQPERAAIPLRRLFQTLLAEFGADAEAKGLRLRVVPSSAWVESDPTMLSRILQNVIANAIRYTDRGTVLLGCRRRGDAVSIEVYDTGAGMTPEALDHVFEEFYQVANPQRDRRLGLGLGLAIVRRLCAVLGHEMDLSSREGHGTVFRIRVPRTPAPAAGPAAAATRPADLEGRRVLVIDNEAPARDAMREILHLWSCTVIAADSRESALAALEPPSEPPDLIVADYRLCDGETGAEAIDAVRARFGRPVPALIVTGDTAPQRLQEATASGYRLLHKPVSAAQLRSLASYLLRQDAAASSRSDPG
jgi:signal transduction histidine kinase